jgi:hypothetical protein
MRYSVGTPVGYDEAQSHAVTKAGPYSENWRSLCGMKATTWPRKRSTEEVTCRRCIVRLENIRLGPATRT